MSCVTADLATISRGGASFGFGCSLGQEGWAGGAQAVDGVPHEVGMESEYSPPTAPRPSGRALQPAPAKSINPTTATRMATPGVTPVEMVAHRSGASGHTV